MQNENQKISVAAIQVSTPENSGLFSHGLLNMKESDAALHWLLSSLVGR